MNKKRKIQLIDYWIENPDKILEIPEDLEKGVNKGDIEKLVLEIDKQEITPEILRNFKKDLQKDLDFEKSERKEKIIWFKEWIYPILAPIIVAILIFLIMNNALNPPKIIETSLYDYYSVPASTDISLPFWISNSNNEKLTIFSIGYKFSWVDHNPEGQTFVSINPPQLNPVGNINTNQSSNEKILNSVGQEGDSIQERVTFKSPPQSNSLYNLIVVINTNKGEITKEVKLNPTETKNE